MEREVNLYEILSIELKTFHGDEIDPPEWGRNYALVFAESRSKARYAFLKEFDLWEGAGWFLDSLKKIESCKLIASNVDRAAGVLDEPDNWEADAFWLPIGKRLGWLTTAEIKGL